MNTTFNSTLTLCANRREDEEDTHYMGRAFSVG